MKAEPLQTDAKGRTQPLDKPNTNTTGAHLPLILNMTYETGVLNRDFNDASNKNILVQAQGQGREIFIMNLNGLVDGQHTDVVANVVGGTPYVIWNKATSQTVCGQTNKQGYSNAYFVDDSPSWYDNRYAFLLNSNQPCAHIAQSMMQWLHSKNPDEQILAAQFVKSNFVLSPAQYDRAYKELNFLSLGLRE